MGRHAEVSEIITKLPYADYAKRPGVNATLLKLVHKKSLLHAKAYLDGTYAEESDVLDFGTCFHSLALEGREDFSVHPATYAAPATHEKVKKGEIKEGDPLPWNFNAGVCAKWKTAQPKGRIILNESEEMRVRAMSNAVRAALGEKIKGRIELSMFGERDGIPMKSRADLIPDDEDAPIIDLKSCASAEPFKFMRSSLDLGYHLQAALTLDVARMCGIDRKSFWLVAAESEPPHAIAILKFDDTPLSLLRVGRSAYRAAFKRLIQAQETGRWPSYGSHHAEDFAPAWMKNELEMTA